MTLTNRDLPVYYCQQYLSFANTYGMYLSYIMDTTLPLDQQMYDEENTWQQMFLNAGLSMFQYHAAAAQEAEKAGYSALGRERADAGGAERQPPVCRRKLRI